MLGNRVRLLTLLALIPLVGLVILPTRANQPTPVAKPVPPAKTAGEPVPPSTTGDSSSAGGDPGAAVPTDSGERASQAEGDGGNRGEDEAGGEGLELPDDLVDPVFDRYVDVRLIGQALNTRDITLLIDCGLQLVEGERILQRKHKSGVTARTLLTRAAKLAGAARDKNELARLTKAIEKSTDKDLVAAIEAQVALAGTPRAVDPGLSVSLEDTDVATLDGAQRLIRRIDEAEFLGSSDALAACEKELELLAAPGPQKAAIKKRLEAAKKGLPKDTDEAAAALLKLSGATRDGGASAAIVAYLSSECANFARQAAEGWFISYGPVVNADGTFMVTFKNVIRYGPFGVGKETWWVDVKGNLAKGTIDSVEGRGSTLVSWIRWYKDSFNNAIAKWSAEYKRKSPSPSADYFSVYIKNRSGKALTVYVHFKDAGSNSWKTFRYTFASGEEARLNLKTKNRYIYIGATGGGSVWQAGSSEDGHTITTVDGKTLKLRKKDMGGTIGKYTYTFNP